VANDLLPELPNRKDVLTRAGEARPLDPKALLADLHALAQPASRRDIGEHLVILVGCFPNAKTDDAEIYGRMLAECVAATSPSVSDLNAARDKLIKRLDFRPSIHQVLEALETEKKERQMRTERIAYIVKDDLRQQRLRDDLHQQRLRLEHRRENQRAALLGPVITDDIEFT
jgi:hypothetical protein